MNVNDAMTSFARNNKTAGVSNPMGEREHNLIWNTEQPSFVTNLFNANGTLKAGDLSTLNNDITSRINYYVKGNTNGLGNARALNYQEMDVFNEPWHGQSHQDNYLGALGVSGVASVYQQTAAAVNAVGANTRLYTNEFNVLQFSPQSISSTGVASGNDPYANWYLNGVQSIQNAGGPVSGIGMELYVNNNVVSPANMLQAMQNLSTATAKNPDGSTNPMPLSLTEFGTSTNTGTSAPSQANFDTDLVDALTMAYGDPQATTFGFWGGVGGPHDLNTNTATGAVYSLYNSSYQLSAAGQAWEQWMSQWQTNLTGLAVDPSGNVSFDGTFGTYLMTIDGSEYEFTLGPGGISDIIAVPEPACIAAAAILLLFCRERGTRGQKRN
jgi:GH35 family endo-1,4-beta-xylanase